MNRIKHYLYENNLQYHEKRTNIHRCIHRRRLLRQDRQRLETISLYGNDQNMEFDRIFSKRF